MIFKRELKIYLLVFLVAALGMHHKEFISYPIDHISHLPMAGAYGLGMIHPIVFSFIIYLIVWIPRIIAGMFGKKSEA